MKLENGKNYWKETSKNTITVTFEMDKANWNIKKNSDTVGNLSRDSLNIRLDQEVVQEAKETGKNIVVAVEDEDGYKLYSWNFTAQNMQKLSNEIAALDLSITISDGKEFEAIQQILSTEDKGEAGIIIRQNASCEILFQSILKVHIGKQKGLKPGKKAFVYIANKDTGKLDSITGGHSYELDEEGYISLNILQFADYAILPKKPDTEVVTSLRNQISSRKRLSLNIGKQKVISVVLPKSLELVKDLKDKTSSEMKGAVTLSYATSDKAIATVDASTGLVTAVSLGEATIIATATLYSGKTKDLKTKVTVQ